MYSSSHRKFHRCTSHVLIRPGTASNFVALLTLFLSSNIFLIIRPAKQSSSKIQRAFVNEKIGSLVVSNMFTNLKSNVLQSVFGNFLVKPNGLKTI